MTTDLTPKQQRFIHEYLIDLNGKQAAIRSGYSPATAEVQASRLLSKAKVAAAVTEARDLLSKRTGITQERVLKEYARLAFLDIRKAYNNLGQLIPIHELDDDTAAAISGIDVVENQAGAEISTDGVRIVDSHTKKIRISDKKGALDSIARHLGMFTDKAELSTPGGKALQFTINIGDAGGDA